MLRKLLHGVVNRTPAVAFTSDDLYRICVLVKSSKDPLGLKEETSFLSFLASQYQTHHASSSLPPSSDAGSISSGGSAPLTPFQKSMMEEVLRPYYASNHTTIGGGSGTASSDKGGIEDAGRNTTSGVDVTSAGMISTTPGRSGDWNGGPSGVAMTSSSHAPSHSPSLTALECLTAMWSLIDEAQAEKVEFSGDRLSTLEKYMKEIETKLRQLSPTETASLVKALATVHYRNYQHVALVSRRSCEVASQLGHKDACQLYHNITKLQCLDSLMPLVQRILSFEKELSIHEVRIVAQALERQQSSSFAGGRLLTCMLNRAAVIISHAQSPTIHRSLLAATTRFNVTRHTAIDAILQDLSRFQKKDDYALKDVSALLRSMNTLEINASHPAYKFLINCVKESVPTAMQVRQLDGIMNILSEVPVDTSEAMDLMMQRLEKDAGKLAIPQLMNILQLLSSYPPAKGHVCIVSLSFAASMRGDSIEAAVLEDILVSLSQLQHFTDDFFDLVRILFKKGGFKKFETLQSILSECTPEVLKSNEGAELAKNGILQLAPILNDQELQQCRKLLLEKGIDDKALQQRVMNRAKQLQRGGGDGGYNLHYSGSSGGGHRRNAGGAGYGSGGGNRGKRRPYDPMDDLIQ